MICELDAVTYKYKISSFGNMYIYNYIYSNITKNSKNN